MKWDSTQGSGKQENCNTNLCPVCGKIVYKAFSWWTKNPEKYKDARRIHTICYFGQELNFYKTIIWR